MGKKSGGGQQTSTTVQKVELPPWVNAASQQNYADAAKVADGLVARGTYQGNTVSGLNNDHTTVFNNVRDSVGMADPYFQSAGNTLQGLQGYGGQTVQAGSFTPEMLAKYQNPYLESVEKNALANVERQRRAALSTVADQAVSAGAFGGSRHGVREGVTNAESARAAGETSDKIRSDSWNAALAAFTGDRDAQLRAALANQSTDLAAAGLRQNAAQALAQVGQGRQQSWLQSNAALQSVADAQRQYQQDLLNQDYNRWNDERSLPVEAINLKLAALGMSPYGSTTTATSTQPKQQQNGLLGALGGISSIASAVLPFFGLSDENEKTNIEKVGKDPDTGIDLYAYDYKSDVAKAKKTGKPLGMKRVGPMAQDVEKAIPNSTKKVGGKLLVKGAVSAPAKAPAKKKLALKKAA